MRSVVPSESATGPFPDHDPVKPVNGPDWAWLTDADNISAAPTPAALIACPNKLEPNSFISSFPIPIDVLIQDTSRRIEDLVSPQCVRFKITDPPLPVIGLTGRRRWIGHLQNTQTDCRWRTAFWLCGINKASDSPSFVAEHLVIGRPCLQQTITRKTS